MAIDHGLATSRPAPGGPVRFLVAWQDPATRLFEAIGLLSADPDGFRFHYLPRAHELGNLRPLPQFPDLGRTYESQHLFSLFSQRLMNRRRSDYGDWVTMLDLDERASDLEVLARSAGHRLGDKIRVFPEPTVEVDGRSAATFFVHGIRYRTAADDAVVTALAGLRKGDQLRFMHDRSNPVSPKAITVDRNSVSLGWVPDPLVPYVTALLASGPTDVRVTRNNGPDAAPNLRLLVTAKGRVPADYRPFSAG